MKRAGSKAKRKGKNTIVVKGGQTLDEALMEADRAEMEKYGGITDPMLGRPRPATEVAGIGRFGIKHDTEKPRTDLLPPRAVLEVADVLRHGAKKYRPNNWRAVMNEPGGRDRYVAAALRHILVAQSGEFADPESGYSHWAHAACCLLFLAEEDK